MPPSADPGIVRRMSDVVAAVNAIPLASLMLVIVVGFSLGRVSVRGVALGPAGATLFVSLAFGHLGLAVSGASGPEDPARADVVSLGGLGFALFVYAVGFDAAPHVFSAFRERRGWRFLVVGAAVNVIAVGATVAGAALFELDASVAAGILSGALTSAPTYAAAAEIARDPTRLSVAFALTYPFGLVGLVLLIQILPRVLREDLVCEASREEARRSRKKQSRPASQDLRRVFEVRNQAFTGIPLRGLNLPRTTGCVVSRVHRRDGGAVLVPDGDTVLAVGDRVVVNGRFEELQAFEERVGPEASDQALQEQPLPVRRIQVRRADVIGRSLKELRIIPRFHCVITRIERGHVEVEPRADVTLVRDDIVEVIGAPDDVRVLARALGCFEPSLHETDIAVYAGGILLGLLLGSIQVRLFGVELGLGTAGGLLVVGLVLGWQQRLGPFQTHVPQEARQLVRDLGILLFIGESGLLAGANMAGVFAGAPWVTVAAGAAVTVLTVIGALAIARAALGLRPLDAWGSVCGGLTSSAALQTVRRASDSNEAAVSYAVAYAVGNVLATAAGPVVVLVTS